MAREKIKKWIKEMKKVFKESGNVFEFIVGAIMIGICIVGIFAMLPYGEQLEMKDYFNFAGVFSGAIFSGLISFLILKANLKSQEEQFRKERKLDSDIKAIDETIKRYETIFKILKEIQIELNKVAIKCELNEEWTTQENMKLLSRVQEYQVEINFELSVLNDISNVEILAATKLAIDLCGKCKDAIIKKDVFGETIDIEEMIICNIYHIKEAINQVIQKNIIDKIHELNKEKLENK